EMEGAAWTLQAVEVVDFGVADVLHLGAEGEVDGRRADALGHHQAMQDLRRDRLPISPGAIALPGAEELVHVARAPGDREVVAAAERVGDAVPDRQVREEPGAVRDSIARIASERALRGDVAEVD